jgi:hypothetical protein
MIGFYDRDGQCLLRGTRPGSYNKTDYVHPSNGGICLSYLDVSRSNPGQNTAGASIQVFVLFYQCTLEQW